MQGGKKRAPRWRARTMVSIVPGCGLIGEALPRLGVKFVIDYERMF